MVEPGQIWKVRVFDDNGLFIYYVAFPEYLLILERTTTSSWAWDRNNKFNVLTNKSHFDSYYAELIIDRYERIL